MSSPESVKRVVALSFQTISATIAAETLQQVLDILQMTEEKAEFPIQAINAFRAIVGKALENAKRDAEESLIADCKAEQPEGLPPT